MRSVNHRDTIVCIEGADDVISGTGLNITSLRSVARRQLIGSAVVALMVTAVALVGAFRPAHGDPPSWIPKMSVQQPSLVDPMTSRVAATKQVELP